MQKIAFNRKVLPIFWCFVSWFLGWPFQKTSAHLRLLCLKKPCAHFPNGFSFFNLQRVDGKVKRTCDQASPTLNRKALALFRTSGYSDWMPLEECRLKGSFHLGIKISSPRSGLFFFGGFLWGTNFTPDWRMNDPFLSKTKLVGTMIQFLKDLWPFLLSFTSLANFQKQKLPS